jgi:uncharacterized Rossmann fold enzyme
MSDGQLQGLIDIQNEVRLAFGWNYTDDYESAKQLSLAFEGDAPFGVDKWNQQARDETLQEIRGILVSSKRVIIIGAAAEKEMLEKINLEDVSIIAADGSVGVLNDFQNLVCVISDLDGGRHIDLAAIEGQRFIIHAHGDNNNTWKKILAEWSALPMPPKLILTHQTNEELFGMSNFGGFTDGDRALCFAIWAGVKSENIELIGFSTKKIGKWSGVTDQNKKLKKLLWMEKIVSMFKLEDQID